MSLPVLGIASMVSFDGVQSATRLFGGDICFRGVIMGIWRLVSVPANLESS